MRAKRTLPAFLLVPVILIGVRAAHTYQEQNDTPSPAAHSQSAAEHDRADIEALMSAQAMGRSVSCSAETATTMRCYVGANALYQSQLIELALVNGKWQKTGSTNGGESFGTP